MCTTILARNPYNNMLNSFYEENEFIKRMFKDAGQSYLFQIELV